MVVRWVVGLESEVCRLLETNMHLEKDKNHKDKYSQVKTIRNMGLF